MSTLRTNTISNAAGTASVPTDTVVSGTAKAWVNFNGTGTVAIRTSFNVSSITDNGVGDFTVNFSTAMPDANYVVSGMGSGESTPSGGGWGDVALRNFAGAGAAPTTSSVRIGHLGAASIGWTDPLVCSIIIYR